MLEKIIIIAIVVVAGVYVARRLLRTGSGGCGCGCDCSSQEAKTCRGTDDQNLKPLDGQGQCCGKR